MSQRTRPLRRAVVVRTERVAPEMVRLTLHSDQMRGHELPFCDHYVKFLFPPAGAPYDRPFDPEAVRDQFAPEHWPVTRTYTIRSADPATGEFVVDVVLHGDAGLAGPWAAQAQPGDEISFHGPGGAWAPSDHAHYVFAGDEAAAPAICRGVELLPGGATATVYLEIADERGRFPVPQREGVTVRWVLRDGAAYGQALASVVRAGGAPDGAGWFVHGVAEMVKDVRHFLFVEQGVPRSDVSISGYWRTGMTEDGWRQTKRDFVAEMETAEIADLATAARH